MRQSDIGYKDMYVAGAQLQGFIINCTSYFYEPFCSASANIAPINYIALEVTGKAQLSNKTNFKSPFSIHTISSSAFQCEVAFGIV